MSRVNHRFASINSTHQITLHVWCREPAISGFQSNPVLSSHTRCKALDGDWIYLCKLHAGPAFNFWKTEGAALFACIFKHTESQCSVHTRSCSAGRRLDIFAILHKSHTWLTPPLCLCVLVCLSHTHKDTHRHAFAGGAGAVLQRHTALF